MYYECRHILPNGAKCKSPALHGQSFCYFHHTQRRPLPRTPSGTLALPVIEDAHSVQQSLNLVLQALAAGRLQPRTASLLLYGLQVASSNLRAIPHEPNYDSVRSAHSLPNNTFIGDVTLADEFDETPDDLLRFEENHPAPEEPGETPIDPDDWSDEYPGDEEDEDDNEEEDGDPDDDEEDEDEDEDDNEEEDGDPDDDEEDEDEDEDDDDDDEAGSRNAETRDHTGDDRDRQENGEINYRQIIRQQLLEAFLPEAAAIHEQQTSPAPHTQHPHGPAQPPPNPSQRNNLPATATESGI